jgi:hypothetical protein
MVNERICLMIRTELKSGLYVTYHFRGGRLEMLVQKYCYDTLVHHL